MYFMGDKRSNQAVLPFDFKGKDIDLYVRQHWNVTFSRQKKVGVLAKKIISAVMSQIKKDDAEFKSYYQFHVSNFVNEGQAATKIYTEIRKAFDELTDLKWLFEDLENEKFAFRHILNTSDVRCGYEKGTITVVLNPLLKPLFLSLAHYTIYELKWYMTFSSWYSMRLYELLSAFRDTGVWSVDIDKYRTLMDCDDKYKKKDGVNNDSDMINRTIGEAILELERTDMAFTVETIKDKPKGVAGRKSIVSLVFRLEKVQQKAVPAKWKTQPENVKTFEKMHIKYKLSEVNLMKYFDVIGAKEVVALLKQWDLKEVSGSPIENKLAYCNKVFVAMGKKAIEDKNVKL
jgi:plasmid replication initiation protein